MGSEPAKGYASCLGAFAIPVARADATGRGRGVWDEWGAGDPDAGVGYAGRPNRSPVDA
jgi:hypothetical protein